MQSDAQEAPAPVAAPEAMRRAWLEANGPREVEMLFRAVVYHPAIPILITDDQRTNHEASAGAGNLLGVPREKIIGSRLDDFAQAGFAPKLPELWNHLLQAGQQEGTLYLKDKDGNTRSVNFKAKTNVLPVRHVVALSEKRAGGIPSWVEDFALFLLDTEGAIAAWYSGAARIYGYTAAEATGQHVSLLYPEEAALAAKLKEELRRSADAGHFGNEGWQVRKDGSRFWANTITAALKDGDAALQGYARIVRDFSDRHENDGKLRRSRARLRPIAPHTAIAGVVSGEFDRVPEANDTFLELAGYTRQDLREGRIHWLSLTPPEFVPLDELAHEEGLRFGACTPYKKELIRKDGARIPVLVATAVLKLCPFQWISFVQDLRERNRAESIEEEEIEPVAEFAEIIGDGPP